jgi:hypothetical protein
VHPIFPEKDGRVLTRPPAIVAPHADNGIDGSGSDDLLDLEIERLLKPYEVRVLTPDRVEQQFTTSRPLVLAITGRSVPNVE